MKRNYFVGGGIFLAFFLFFFLENMSDAEIKQEGIPHAIAFGVNNVGNPTCADNYKLLRSSTQFKSSSTWDMSFVTSERKTMDLFQDINGDGLTDYLYTRNWDFTCGNMPMNQTEYCLYFNNGNGWEKKYTCVTRCESVSGKDTPVYYGDCAG